MTTTEQHVGNGARPVSAVDRTGTPIAEAVSPSQRPDSVTSVFHHLRGRRWAYRWEGELYVDRLVGGVPADPAVVEGWVRASVADNKPGSVVRQMIVEAIADRGLSEAEAIDEVTANLAVNGFNRDPERGLWVRGHTLKAAMKESAVIVWGKQRFGKTSKGIKPWLAEHVFVEQDALFLGVHEPSGTQTRFVHKWDGSAIAREDYVDGARVRFSVISDHDLDVWSSFAKGPAPEEGFWGALWLTAEQQGWGSTRSQGFGRFAVVAWDRVDPS